MIECGPAILLGTPQIWALIRLFLLGLFLQKRLFQNSTWRIRTLTTGSRSKKKERKFSLVTDWLVVFRAEESYALGNWEQILVVESGEEGSEENG